MSTVVTIPNPDLEVLAGNKSRWTHADNRRRGWHSLHRIARYGITLRAARVMTLETRQDLSIARLEGVRLLTALPCLSAMVVIRGQQILYERYATDFAKDRPHSIQSISKTLMNLIVGVLVDAGYLSLSETIGHYVPEIGSGYADATLQQVLNMDVVNDYSEDFADPSATYYSHEEAMGWRLPRDPMHEITQRRFLPRISSADTTNHTGKAQYKDANTDVLAWVVERATSRNIRSFLADIVDAAGIEGMFHITTDREGVPTIDGGVCLTARDLARYFALFVRGGLGVGGQRVGSADFLERTMASGVPLAPPFEPLRYSNHLMVSGASIGHSGWGGQYAVANLKTGTIGVLLSVLENEHATTQGYIESVIQTFDSIVSSPR